MHLSRRTCFWTWICLVNMGLMERGPYGHWAAKSTVTGNLSQTQSADQSTWCLCWLLFLSNAPSTTPGKLQSGIKKSLLSRAQQGLQVCCLYIFSHAVIPSWLVFPPLFENNFSLAQKSSLFPWPSLYSLLNNFFAIIFRYIFKLQSWTSGHCLGVCSAMAGWLFMGQLSSWQRAWLPSPCSPALVTAPSLSHHSPCWLWQLQFCLWLCRGGETPVSRKHGLVLTTVLLGKGALAALWSFVGRAPLGNRKRAWLSAVL